MSNHIAFIFPGQGSQQIGMGQSLRENYSLAADRFREADGVLGWSLSDLCQNGPEDSLTATQHAQPALFVVSAILVDLMRERGVTPMMLAGHSLGEYSAYYAAGLYPFADGLRLVKRRGELMADASSRVSGTMAAVIGLADEEVERVCAATAGTVVTANFNSVGQVVISGEADAVQAAMTAAKEAGAKKVVPLSVAGPFHSPLMGYVEAPFREVLAGAELNEPSLPLVANVTARQVASSGEAADLLVTQLSSSVRWTQSVRTMIAAGVTDFVELGPKKVLAGMIKRIDRSVTVINVEDAPSLEAAVENLS